MTLEGPGVHVQNPAPRLAGDVLNRCRQSGQARYRGRRSCRGEPRKRLDWYFTFILHNCGLSRCSIGVIHDHAFSLTDHRIQTVPPTWTAILLDLRFDNLSWEWVPMRCMSAMVLSLARPCRGDGSRDPAGGGHAGGGIAWTTGVGTGAGHRTLKVRNRPSITVHPHVVEFLVLRAPPASEVVTATNAHPRSLALKMENPAGRTLRCHRLCAHDQFWSRNSQNSKAQRRETIRTRR